MTNNSFVYFEDAVVSRPSHQYKVELEAEEVTIFLKENNVDAIAAKSEQDENLIAILLAYVEYVRRSRTVNHKVPAPIQEQVMVEGFSIILRALSIEELIGKIKAMKWHEIVNALNSESPIEEIQKL